MNFYNPENIKVIVWGASGYAVTIAKALVLMEAFKVTGFIDSVHPKRRGKLFC